MQVFFNISTKNRATIESYPIAINIIFTKNEQEFTQT